ncbi:hypothetical protein MJG53_013491 [Ovis ammon polii x Ovis aries]|uniref:Uncharacterized protein n=1 Tax=Ovis ammon polii x Ovis aries TaxID=2918886 RepID=A0ACB9UIF7_9CETA|nr:hypothetical protein MJG53_013491 [Ovis ammon polii x Ovis aries]
MIFSPEGLPGPGHTGRETLDTEGSLIIRNVMTLDVGSYMVVLETSRGRRSATEQIPIKEADVEPTEPAPISRNPPLSLSGGSAIALIAAASVAGLVLVGNMLFTFIQKLRDPPS